MLSCDTMALTSKSTIYGENMLAKNSDRPTAEAQSLRVFEAGNYELGETLSLTDLEIPQVQSTYAVVGSQPYWTWGFEMGFNEKGLIIRKYGFWRLPAENGLQRKLMTKLVFPIAIQ